MNRVGWDLLTKDAFLQLYEDRFGDNMGTESGCGAASSPFTCLFFLTFTLVEKTPDNSNETELKVFEKKTRCTY